jgi:hypothetical protein
VETADFVAVSDDPSATVKLSINQAYQRFYDRLVQDDAAWQMPTACTDIPKVYISSTIEDLAPHRTAVRDGASKLAADLVAVVVAHRYGEIVRRECEAAIEKGKELLAFVVDPGYASPHHVRAGLRRAGCPWH